MILCNTENQARLGPTSRAGPPAGPAGQTYQLAPQQDQRPPAPTSRPRSTTPITVAGPCTGSTGSSLVWGGQGVNPRPGWLIMIDQVVNHPFDSDTSRIT